MSLYVEFCAFLKDDLANLSLRGIPDNDPAVKVLRQLYVFLIEFT
jgi:hypothetical protein